MGHCKKKFFFWIRFDFVLSLSFSKDFKHLNVIYMPPCRAVFKLDARSEIVKIVSSIVNREKVHKFLHCFLADSIFSSFFLLGGGLENVFINIKI